MITYHAGMEIGNEITSITGIPDAQEVEIGARAQILGQNPLPTITTNDQFIKYVFVGWSEDPNSNNIKYYPGQMSDIIYEDTDLYAVWRISLSNLDWKIDYYWVNEGEPFDKTFRWVDDGSISRIKITESTDGAKVEMIGNSRWEGKGATWATFKSEFIEIQEFQFKYSINKGDSFNSGGFMFNVIETPTTLEGYMLSINFAGDFFRMASGKTGAIYKFVYNKGNSIGNPEKNKENVESLKLIETFNFGAYTSGRESSGSGTVSIKVVDGGYLITANELSQDCFVPVANIQPDTFGFYSDHYHHFCQQIGYFILENIKVVVVRNK